MYVFVLLQTFSVDRNYWRRHGHRNRNRKTKIMVYTMAAWWNPGAKSGKNLISVVLDYCKTCKKILKIENFKIKWNNIVKEMLLPGIEVKSIASYHFIEETGSEGQESYYICFECLFLTFQRNCSINTKSYIYHLPWMFVYFSNMKVCWQNVLFTNLHCEFLNFTMNFWSSEQSSEHFSEKLIEINYSMSKK